MLKKVLRIVSIMALVIMVLSVVQAQDTPVNIRFYGRIDEFGSMPGMIEKLQKHFEGKYNIEMIPVDFGNIDTIIKTAILSGDPADIYFYWPGALRSYIDDGLVLDLTPYLEANDKEWANTFIPGNLAQASYDGGHYYAVPDNQTGGAIYVNDTLAEKLGVTIPDEMTWEEFVKANEQIKSSGNGIFPFAIQQQWQSWLPRAGVVSLSLDAGIAEGLSKGEIPLTNEILKTATENAGALYKNEYVYPGDGALIATQDEILAAFAQGKIVMVSAVFTAAQQLQKLGEENSFTVRPVLWPRMGKEKVVFGGTNGWMIPHNAPHPDAAVEILKYWTGAELQAINVEYGIISSNAELKITDPGAAALAKMGSYFPINAEFQSISTELSVYADQNWLPDYVLGESVDSILAKMEAMRLAAKSK